MATILFFDPARCRKPDATASARKTERLSANILMFTGIRREPLGSMPRRPSPVRHAPMFDDPAPGKPVGKKRRRGKTG